MYIYIDELVDIHMNLDMAIYIDFTSEKPPLLGQKKHGPARL